MAVSSSPGNAPVTVVIAGGGTGGHLYPGIAVARELLRQRPGSMVSFAGTARGLEARVIPREGFELDLIRSAGLKGKSLMSRARGAMLLAPSLLDAWRLLTRRGPAVVVGVGGYSSGPVVMLAALRGIPTMVLEQNAAPGLTNRLLARVVRAAAVTYDDTRRFFGKKGIVTGNPVRAEFFAASQGRAASDRARVLILGGSQGAHAINLAFVAAAPLLAAGHDIDIVHQTGARDVDDVRAGYAAAGVTARAEAFLDPVAPEVLSADVVVCRAGATTLAELAAAGRPAVLIPFPAATDDHQRKNAQVLVDAGAAVMVEEEVLTPQTLAAAVGALLADAGRRATMSVAMRMFAKPEAAAHIVRRILELAA